MWNIELQYFDHETFLFIYFFMVLTDCSFENRIFVDGEAFPSPVSVCEECRCVSGRIDCHQPPCARPNCNSPLPGTCCNNCNGDKIQNSHQRTKQKFSNNHHFPLPAGCSYAGKEYPNGQDFQHPTDPCRTCSCRVRMDPPLASFCACSPSCFYLSFVFLLL